MKYAIAFFCSDSLIDASDEMIIMYDKYSDRLIEFLQLYKNKKITIDVSVLSNEDFEKGKEIFKQIINYEGVIRDSIVNMERFDFYKEFNIPFFLRESVKNFDNLKEILEEGVSEVYITDDLGFDLKRVRDVVGPNIKIRVYPRINQIADDTENKFLGFFIRPEDTLDYEKYIDVFEFNEMPEAEETLIKIYKDGFWHGDLQHLIVGLDFKIDNREILPLMNCRVNCRKRCRENKCDICNRILSISDKLDEQGIFVLKTKE